MTQSSVAEIFQNSDFREDDHIISASDHNNWPYFIIAYILSYPKCVGFNPYFHSQSVI